MKTHPWGKGTAMSEVSQGLEAVIDDDEPLVWVRRQWNDWRQAKHRLCDFDGPRWSDMSGGVHARAPQPFMHGQVWCDGMLEGEVAHTGSHGPCPHRITVCVVKRDNAPAVYAMLLKRAGPKPQKRSHRR